MKNKEIILFFWRYIKPYKWYYGLMLIAPIVSSFYSVVCNYAIKLFLDAMEKNTFDSYHNILFPIVLFFSAEFALNIVWRISNVAEWNSVPYVRRSILINSYDYVQHHSYIFFQNNFTGLITSKLKGVLTGYDKFWAEMHHGLFLQMLKITVNFSMLAFVNIYLTIFMVCWICIYVPVMYKLSETLSVLTFQETESRHALFGQISDKISNIVSLLSFSARDRERQTLDRQIYNDFIPKQIRVCKYAALLNMVAGILYLGMFAFILFFMIYLRMHDVITIGDFAFVFGLVFVISEDIWQATTAFQDFTSAMGDLKSSMSILKIQQENLDVKNAYPLVIKSPTIEFHNVSFKYDENNIIFKDLNLTIAAGEKVGLVGHSGSGKSSLINLLLRYFKNNKGEILIDGQNINLVTQDSLRDNIAVIPQDTMLFHRTVMENIRFGNPSAPDHEIIEASKKAHIHEFIMTLPKQYATHVGERGTKLSGGQRQRIAIARAILKNAPILILDEATSALDSQTEQLIQESLNFFIEDKQKTVIAIAHRLSTLKHMDRIIVLDKGVIVEEGTHDQLLQNSQSLYKKLWDYQEI